MKDNPQYYCYISTRACYDPVKTIFVCAPGDYAATLEMAQQFAKDSGWQALAEYDGAALILPLAPDGWQAQSTDLYGQIFRETRNAFSTRNGKSLLGRRQKLWCWETLIYLVGYDDGAVFAGNSMVAHPNHFAATALIGGAPEDYSTGRLPSDHWLVANVSEDYDLRNDQIPSSLWLLNASAEKVAQSVDYFSAVNGFEKTPKKITLGGISVVSCYQNRQNPAQQFLVSENVQVSGMELAHVLLESYFEHTIRWKDGPDGTLRQHLGRTDFYTEPRFLHSSVMLNGIEYPYSLHFPQGMTLADVKGLPLVFSVHGRGEPAWLFSEKNGWDVLADETKAFVLICPDSPGNIWLLHRDGEAFASMIDQVCREFQLDRTRVYLSGFSNGGSITREVGTTYPWLFAAIAPYNAPVHVPGLTTEKVICPDLLASGYELPYWVYVGDNDPAAGMDVDSQLEVMLEVNHCQKRQAQELTTCFAPTEIWTGDNHYTPEKGYAQGERFRTHVYCDNQGIPKVGYTVMKNMPHGAICEQSFSTWEFFKNFRRPEGSKQVQYL